MFNQIRIPISKGIIIRKNSYKVKTFEEKFRKKFKSKYSLAVTSGTAALRVALAALNIGIGDQITYRYDKIPTEIKEKYQSISKICLEYDVPVPAAALQFSYSNKLISSMILGIDRIEQIQQNFENLNYPIPKELWDNLIKENLLDERSMIDV